MSAILFFLTTDPNHNTTAPQGELASSGWEWQGVWGSFLGTPIAPHFFITARHIGGTVGDKFILGGAAYSTTAFFDDPESDLRLCKVREAFPSFAPLYSRDDEVNLRLVVFGRGTQRGDEVLIPSSTGLRLKGWRWGSEDGRLRWGENRVGSVVRGAAAGSDAPAEDLLIGEHLRIPFDPVTSGNESHLSSGDSGGAVFIRDGSTWKLAGINRAVDGPYNTGNQGFGFHAAIFDEGGLYRRGEGRWQLVPDVIQNAPGAFYATRISSRLEWIRGILSRPVSDPPVLQSSPTVAGPFEDEPDAAVDEQARVIRLPQPGEFRCYRLRAPVPVRLTNWRLESRRLVLSYE